MGWQILAGAVLLAAVAAVFFALYVALQGEEKVEIAGRERTALICRGVDGDRAVFSLKAPIVNNGRQDGIVLDAFARILLPSEQFDLARAAARLERDGFPRADDYMEAFIIHPGRRFDLELTVVLDAAGSDGNIKYALDNMVDVDVDIYYQVVGRGAPHIEKCIISLPLEEFRCQGGGGQ